MRKLLVTETWLLIFQAVFIACFLSGCAAGQAAKEILFEPVAISEPMKVDLAKDKASFQAILDDKDATQFDKNAARYAIRGIEIMEKQNEGELPITGILAALGLPGAAVLGVLLKRVKARLDQQTKVSEQTIAGISEFEKTNTGGLPVGLKTALDNAQDEDVKAVVASVKATM